jgi:CDP-diacylglycerol--glycerol-3-phosphate 3-phosphatidyltransferase
MIYNAANILTMSRLVMAALFFVLIALKSWAAVPVLLLAGVTDLLDGWVARNWNQQTDFGRIADPCIDKILICCGFIFLVKHLDNVVGAWMAAVIVGRELIVTALRSLAESRGTDFSATFWGKSKMVVQFIALAYLIFLVAFKEGREVPDVLLTTGHVLAWTTIVVTVMSGLVYVVQAERLVRRREDA